MKRFALFFGILIALFAFAAPASAEEYPIMSGNVGKYKVKMKLNINWNTNKVTGWYYYTSKGPKAKISLSGTCRVNSDNGTVLIERVNGKQTGKFVGSIGIGTHIISFDGDWISPSGKRLGFSVDAEYR